MELVLTNWFYDHFSKWEFWCLDVNNIQGREGGREGGRREGGVGVGVRGGGVGRGGEARVMAGRSVAVAVALHTV
jgi:hypothetical protein